MQQKNLIFENRIYLRQQSPNKVGGGEGGECRVIIRDARVTSVFRKRNFPRRAGIGLGLLIRRFIGSVSCVWRSHSSTSCDITKPKPDGKSSNGIKESGTVSGCKECVYKWADREASICNPTSQPTRQPGAMLTLSRALRARSWNIWARVKTCTFQVSKMFTF